MPIIRASRAAWAALLLVAALTRPTAAESLDDFIPLAWAEPIQTPEAQPAPPVLSKHELLKKYVWSTLGPGGWLHATFAAGLGQIDGAPPSWGHHWSGYEKRWASSFAGSAIGGTAKYAAARLLHQDPSFIPCTCTGFGPRLAHAVASPFAARDADGRRVFSPATVAGLAAGDLIPATTWYPERHGFRSGVINAVIDLAAKIGVDTVREFFPRIRNGLHL